MLENQDPEKTQDSSNEDEELQFEKLSDPVEEVQENGLNELEELQKEVVTYKQLAEENREEAELNKEQYLRALADLENYRRRAKKEKEDILKYGAVPLLESLLPVLDNFKRALDVSSQSNDAEMLREGIEMVYRQFVNVLSEVGLVKIETANQPFNPHEHNAVMQVEAEELESGMIVEELQAGYRFHDRVIRPSMVKVST